MPTSVIGSVGTGTATASATCDITLTMDVDRCTPAVPSALILFVQRIDASDPGAGFTAADNAGSSGSPYYAGPNKLSSSAVGLVYGTGTASVNQRIIPYMIINQMTSGDVITLTDSAPRAYWRATAVWVEGLQIGGICTSASLGMNYVTGTSGSGSGTTFVDDVTISSTSADGFYFMTQASVATSALSWTDSGVFLLDSWYDDGANQASGIIGYQATSPVANPYDIAGSTDTAGVVGWAGAFYREAGSGTSPGPLYCPASAPPVFNNRIRLIA